MKFTTLVLALVIASSCVFAQEEQKEDKSAHKGEHSVVGEEYAKIREDIKKFLDSDIFETITNVAPKIAAIPIKMDQKATVVVDVASSIAKTLHPLFEKLKDTLKGWFQQSKFKDLYKKTITEPCNQIRAKRNDLDAIIEKDPEAAKDFKENAELESFRFASDLCQLLHKTPNTISAAYKLFKKEIVATAKAVQGKGTETTTAAPSS